MKKLFIALLLFGANELSAAAERQESDFDKVAHTWLGSRMFFGFKVSDLRSMIKEKSTMCTPGEKVILDQLSDDLNHNRSSNGTGLVREPFMLYGGTRYHMTGKGYKFFGLPVGAEHFNALGRPVPLEIANEVAKE